jgi:hypothetical protein
MMCRLQAYGAMKPLEIDLPFAPVPGDRIHLLIDDTDAVFIVSDRRPILGWDAQNWRPTFDRIDVLGRWDTPTSLQQTIERVNAR